MSTCSNCGAGFSNEDAKFCGGCGAPNEGAVPRHASPAMPQPVQPTTPAPQQVLAPVAQASPQPVLQQVLDPAPVLQPAQPAAAPAMRVGMLGNERSTAAWIFFTYITAGFASIFWLAGVHGDMKRYQGKGLGAGAAALVLIPFFGGVFLMFHTPARVGQMYADHGLAKPCSGPTAFWLLLPIVGVAIYFVKVNESLNSFWRSLAA